MTTSKRTAPPDGTGHDLEPTFQGCPLGRNFDQHSPEYREAVPDVFATMHAECPVIRSDAHGGFYFFTRYDDAVTILRDHETFSSYNDLEGTGNGGKGAFIPQMAVRIGFMETDPPQHGQYRKVFTQWFTPARIAAYEDRMRQFAAELIDRAAARGEFDAVTDLANPLTAVATLDVMGMPVDDDEMYHDPLHKTAYINAASPEFGDLLTEIQQLRARMHEVVQARRAEVDPPDDYVTRLVAMEIDGRPLSDETVVDIIWMATAGGFDTSSSTMAYAMRYLTEHPEERARLQADPELIPTAVEEFVRHGAPQSATARTVMRPTTVGGVDLVPGDRVLVGLRAANFDPTKFDDAYAIKLDRRPNRHLSFSDGVHRCAGTRFTRVELIVFLEELLRRMPDFVVHSDRVVELPTAGVATAFISVPAAASRSDADRRDAS